MPNFPDWHDVPGWFTDEDAEAYAYIISRARECPTLIELGCYCGRSLASISPLLWERNAGVIAIDTFNSVEQYKHNDYMDEFFDRFRLTLDQFRLNGRTDIIRGLSTSYFPVEKPDIVFIDTRHDESTTTAELEHWFPRVAEGGWICGHDWGTVKPFVEKYIPMAHSIKGGVWGFQK